MLQMIQISVTYIQRNDFGYLTVSGNEAGQGRS